LRREKTPSKRVNRWHPVIEVLEARQLLSGVTWNGKGDGTSWTDASNWSDDAVPGSGDDVTINLTGNPTIEITSGTQSVQSLNMTGGTLTASGSGVTLTVTGTTVISGANLYAESGASLSLAQLTSYTGNTGTTTLEATGTGSALTLGGLNSVTEGSNGYAAQVQFEALAGGTVDLRALTEIDTGTVVLEADGAGSTLDAKALTSFAEAGGWTYSTLQASNGGAINDGGLASLSGVNLKVAGTGDDLMIGGLTSYDGGNITVSGGASLSLPGVTSYAGNTGTTTLEATGTGSALTLGGLNGVTEAASNYAATTQFEALAGGRVTLSGLQSIGTGTVVLEADGAGSTLDAKALTSFAEAGGWSDSTLQDSNGGTVDLNSLISLSGVNLNVAGTGEKLILSGLTSLENGNITVSGGASLTLPPPTAFTAAGTTATVSGSGSSLAIGSGILDPLPTSGTGVVINVPEFPQGMTLNLNPNGTFSGGTTFNVGGGATVNIPSGTYAGGTTFNIGGGAIVNVHSGTFTGGATYNVGQGAIVNLTDGQTVTYGGTLTGSGSGTVMFSGGGVDPAIGSGIGPANTTLSATPECARARS
jgi:hypothetical protein